MKYKFDEFMKNYHVLNIYWVRLPGYNDNPQLLSCDNGYRPCLLIQISKEKGFYNRTHFLAIPLTTSDEGENDNDEFFVNFQVEIDTANRSNNGMSFAKVYHARIIQGEGLVLEQPPESAHVKPHTFKAGISTRDIENGKIRESKYYEIINKYSEFYEEVFKMAAIQFKLEGKTVMQELKDSNQELREAVFNYEKSNEELKDSNQELKEAVKNLEKMVLEMVK